MQHFVTLPSILFSAVLMIVACSQAPSSSEPTTAVTDVQSQTPAVVLTSQPSATFSPTPTATPFPEPSPTPEPSPASSPIPTSTKVPEPVVSGATPQEYAVKCGEAMAASESIGSGAQGEIDFLNWVEDLEALKAPVEFIDFHDARTTQYSAQHLMDGPSSQSQAAYERELEIVASMRPDLRDVLLDGGCLQESDIMVETAFLKARARMKARTFSAGRLTVEEYALHCRDINITAPAMDNADGLARHFLNE